MMAETVIFIPSKRHHWDMYLPIVDSLSEAGIDVRFALIPGYSRQNDIPHSELLSGINIWNPDPCMKMLFQNNLQRFSYAYYSLMPAWRTFLGALEPGAVVVAQDGAPIQRLLLNCARAYGFNRMLMQDGYYVTIPGKYGWALERKTRLFLKMLIHATPFRRFITLSFGSVADYCGLYGEKIQHTLCQNRIFGFKQTSVIGSPRFAVFRKRVAEIKLDHEQKKRTILCLPTTFPNYREKRLENSQDEGLKWLSSIVKDFNISNEKDIVINIKVKRGYDHMIRRYESFLNGPEIQILSGDESLERLFAKAAIVVTMGSTSALEAVVCKKPVVQIMPPYLFDNYMKIYGLPVAKSILDAKEMIEKALFRPTEYITNCYGDVSKELADIDPEYDSIEETTKWFLRILNI